LPINLQDEQEVKLRSPGYWLNSIKSPTWVFEGGTGNIQSLRHMKAASTNPQIHFIPIVAATHFSILAPTNAMLAKKLLADTGATCSLAITPDEADANYASGAK
jgi:hypothetical protein